MLAYRYFTKIDKDGTIHISDLPQLLNKEVELIIVPQNKKINQKINAVEFVKKWAGFLKCDDTDKAKFKYLENKKKK